jgi:cellulose synthase/poly-beta-1,6-N-acetylglucosamine synthase-like glycosyltransferase
MKQIEIPYNQERGPRYRFFEILPGALSWLTVLIPIILSLINPLWAAFFVIAYLIMQFCRAVGVSWRALQGFHTMKRYQEFDWVLLNEEIEAAHVDPRAKREKWHRTNVQYAADSSLLYKPSEHIHVAMIAAYKESREVLEPTVQAVLDSNYDAKRIMLVFAYEARGGARTKQVVSALVKKYGEKFYDAIAYEHPADIPGELVGKGGNITFAGRGVQQYFADKKVDANRVIVTTLDADNRPHKNYFAALSYVYAMSRDPVHTSYQPPSIYTNNIWDAPAPMRVLATGNTYYNTTLARRQHLLRNFSAHAQGLQALIETDFWSVRTIVEDGHQFWRAYFRFDGNHQVFPVYAPIYQDAVLSDTYMRTLKAQFVQLRRWTWGASDIAYFADKAFFNKSNTIPLGKRLMKFGRLLEGHVTWASAPIILAFAAFIPVLFNPDSYAANQLPVVVSYIQRVALVGALASVYICFKTLPPRPLRYRRHRTLWMVLQWVYMPVTSLGYMSAAAFYSQTRLMFGKYLDKFDVTEKAVVTESVDGKIKRAS